MYYEIKLKVDKETPKGVKETVEQFVTDCDLFSEAEARGFGLYKGACDVTGIVRSAVREIVNPTVEGKSYWRATIVDVFVEDDGTEKETKYKVLVAADDMQEATRLVNDYMRQGLETMRLDGIVKTKILEVIGDGN